MNPLSFGRDVLSDPGRASGLEWLVTNGIGGFASGTASGALARRDHGLLFAAVDSPLHRRLLLARLGERIEVDGRAIELDTNHWAGGAIHPEGFRHLESFRLDETVPVWIWAIGETRIEKRVWMEQGENTTYVRYRVLAARASIPLTLTVLVNDRHAREIRTHGQGSPRVEPALGGLKIVVEEGGQPLWLLAPRAEFHVNSTWHHGHRLERESEQGLADLEDHLCAGEIHAELESGESLMVVASTRRDVGLSEAAPLALAGALARRRAHDRSLLETWKRSHPGAARVAPDWIHQLVLAADSFIVERPTMGDPSGRLILSGYPGSGNRARDAMIALSGLTLVTGRSEVARAVLESYARRLDQGMLPSGSAEPDGATDYDSVDASLWFFQAVRAYHDATADDAFLARMYPVLEDIGAWYERGTRFGIRVDEDMLVTQGANGSSLTWMDARTGDHAVSPRHGKAVEVNALWYNALTALTVFARRLKRPAENYDAMAERVARGFARFWNAETSHLFDILDGPEGNDPTLRPNQILAVSLPDSPLTAAQRRAVVDACGRQLATSYGLRTLAPDDSRYQGTCTGDPSAQAVALHQGTVWPWLLPHFALAYARTRGDRETALGFLEPLGHRVGVFGVGWLPERADGEAPHVPRGAIAHACTVAETLRVWHELALEKRRARRRVPARTVTAETVEV